MIKKIKYLLIIFPIILSILLVVNICKYQNTKNNLNKLNTNISNYQEKIKVNNQKKEKLITELNNLKEEKKDKIWEYDRWIKWNQEIKEKIS